MKQDKTLKLDENNLFNKERLQQYDRDGQIGFLGYLIRHRKWKIADNNIVFPYIKSTEEIEKVLSDYNTSAIKDVLNIQRQALSDVIRFGTYNYEQILDRKLEEVEEREDNKNICK